MKKITSSGNKTAELSNELMESKKEPLESEKELTEQSVAECLYITPGLGSVRLKKLFEAAGGAERILGLEESEIKSLIGEKGFQSLRKVQIEYERDREGLLKRMRNYRQREESKGIRFVFCGEKKYPKRLLKIPDYPFGLYYTGKLPSEEKPVVSVIGARECSEYGRKCAEIFGKTLAEYGVSVVSGMARGVDGIAQRSALEAGGESFAVLGCGVDICYPSENAGVYEDLKKKGGILSEFPPGTEPKSNLFPARNRIISGICDLLLVVEARKKSGTYITVCQALEQGKEIFAVPGRITDGLSDGCNKLIAEGAGIAANPMMVLEALWGVDASITHSPLGNTDSVEESLKNERAGLESGNENRKKETEWEESEKEETEREQAKNTENRDKDLVLRVALLRTLEETPKSMEEILVLLGKLGMDVSYTDLLCELTNLCIEGVVDGVGNYYRRL